MAEPTPAPAVVARVLPAPPDVVYDEWLDAEGMTEWMCPRPAVPTRIQLDPKVGGRFLFEIDDEGFELSIEGEYLELDRPHRLSFTWNCSTWEPTDPDSVVTVLLEPRGADHTLMTIRHAQLPPKLVDDHQGGWTAIGDQLEAWLGRRPRR
jgi:uncharacterized protein YndB with AHSA1/START domain